MIQIQNKQQNAQNVEILQGSQVQKKSQIKQPQKKQFQKNYGHWNSTQNIKYLVFIDYHREFFDYKIQRDLWRVYKGMSNFIQTRDSSQCRSHHQKMIQKHQSLQSLIITMRSSYSEKKVSKIWKIYIEEYLQETQNLKFLKNTWLSTPKDQDNPSTKLTKNKSKSTKNKEISKDKIETVLQNNIAIQYQPLYTIPFNNFFMPYYTNPNLMGYYFT